MYIAGLHSQLKLLITVHVIPSLSLPKKKININFKEGRTIQYYITEDVFIRVCDTYINLS